jgi:Uma2 family endonuclease
MTPLIERQATYADLEAVPEHLIAEIIFGELVTHPQPVRRHGGAASVLGMVLGSPYQLGMGGAGGWIFVGEPELRLGPHVLVPDLAAWRKERVTEPPDKAYFEVAPDWICEVLSPSTEKYDKGGKRRIYAEYEVGHLWYVDPRVKLLEVFARQEHNWLLTEAFFDKEEVCGAPFRELAFSLGLLWPFDELAGGKAN